METNNGLVKEVLCADPGNVGMLSFRIVSCRPLLAINVATSCDLCEVTNTIFCGMEPLFQNPGCTGPMYREMTLKTSKWDYTFKHRHF